MPYNFEGALEVAHRSTRFQDIFREVLAGWFTIVEDPVRREQVMPPAACTLSQDEADGIIAAVDSGVDYEAEKSFRKMQGVDAGCDFHRLSPEARRAMAWEVYLLFNLSVEEIEAYPSQGLSYFAGTVGPQNTGSDYYDYLDGLF